MWFNVKQWYEALGFTDPLSDQQRIDEFKWIVQQLRKYMFSKQDVIVGHENLEGMVAEVDNLLSKAEEYGDERKKIVYNFMRDHWLYEIRNHLNVMMMDMEIEKYDQTAFDEEDDNE